jgi:hypothetical protein
VKRGLRIQNLGGARAVILHRPHPTVADTDAAVDGHRPRDCDKAARSKCQSGK